MARSVDELTDGELAAILKGRKEDKKKKAIAALSIEERERQWLPIVEVGKMAGIGRTKMFALANEAGFPLSQAPGEKRTRKDYFDEWYSSRPPVQRPIYSEEGGPQVDSRGPLQQRMVMSLFEEITNE